MRILIFQRFCLRTVGCAERVWRHAEYFVSQGHQVTLIDFPHAQRLREYPTLRPATPAGVQLEAWNRQAVALPWNARRAIRLAREHDVLHLWKCYPDAALPAVWAAALTRKPLHYDWDDLEGGAEGTARGLTGSWLVGTLVGRWERALLRWVDTVSVASDGLAQLCQQWSDLKPVKSPVGADGELFCPLPPTEARAERAAHAAGDWYDGGPVFVYIGQLEVAAYADWALRAFALLPPPAGAKLWIIGDGSDRARLEQLANDLKVSANVVFTGYQPRERVAELLRVATLSVMPFENSLVAQCKSPLKIVESLASGIPVVATSVGDIPEMVGAAGLCSDPRQGPKGLADAIRALCANPAELDRLRLVARQRAQQEYRWSVSAARILQLYQSQCERNNHSES